MGKWSRIIYVVLAAVVLYSCSTTRVLQDGEYRLQKNSLKVTNDRKFNSRSLELTSSRSPIPRFSVGILS